MSRHEALLTVQTKQKNEIPYILAACGPPFQCKTPQMPMYFPEKHAVTCSTLLKQATGVRWCLSPLFQMLQTGQFAVLPRSGRSCVGENMTELGTRPMAGELGSDTLDGGDHRGDGTRAKRGVEIKTLALLPPSCIRPVYSHSQWEHVQQSSEHGTFPVSSK